MFPLYSKSGYMRKKYTRKYRKLNLYMVINLQINTANKYLQKKKKKTVKLIFNFEYSIEV